MVARKFWSCQHLSKWFWVTWGREPHHGFVFPGVWRLVVEPAL